MLTYPISLWWNRCGTKGVRDLESEWKTLDRHIFVTKRLNWFTDDLSGRHLLLPDPSHWSLSAGFGQVSSYVDDVGALWKKTRHKVDKCETRESRIAKADRGIVLITSLILQRTAKITMSASRRFLFLRCHFSILEKKHGARNGCNSVRVLIDDYSRLQPVH